MTESWSLDFQGGRIFSCLNFPLPLSSLTYLLLVLSFPVLFLSNTNVLVLLGCPQAVLSLAGGTGSKALLTTLSLVPVTIHSRTLPLFPAPLPLPAFPPLTSAFESSVPSMGHSKISCG